MPSKKILDEKKAKTTILAEKFKKAKMVMFTEYRGITVEDDTKLRNELRASGGECMVVKNSIISHAAKEAGIENFEAQLEGPTAVVIDYEDYTSAAKVINDYAKTHDFYKFKSGVMDGKAVGVNEVIKIASLPSKETLYAMVASALIGNIRNLAVVLNQTKEAKEAN